VGTPPAQARERQRRLTATTETTALTCCPAVQHAFSVKSCAAGIRTKRAGVSTQPVTALRKTWSQWLFVLLVRARGCFAVVVFVCWLVGDAS
jgi:hypothetical protein